MGLELTKVHHYVKEPGGNSVRLARTNPAIRFSHKDHTTVWLQGGVFYYEGGEPLDDDLPPWIRNEIGKCSSKALREAGYKGEDSSERQNLTVEGEGKFRRMKLASRRT